MRGGWEGRVCRVILSRCRLCSSGRGEGGRGYKARQEQGRAFTGPEQEEEEEEDEEVQQIKGKNIKEQTIDGRDEQMRNRKDRKKEKGRRRVIKNVTGREEKQQNISIHEQLINQSINRLIATTLVFHIHLFTGSWCNKLNWRRSNRNFFVSPCFVTLLQQEKQFFILLTH